MKIRLTKAHQFFARKLQSLIDSYYLKISALEINNLPPKDFLMNIFREGLSKIKDNDSSAQMIEILFHSLSAIAVTIDNNIDKHEPCIRKHIIRKHSLPNFANPKIDTFLKSQDIYSNLLWNAGLMVILRDFIECIKCNKTNHFMVYSIRDNSMVEDSILYKGIKSHHSQLVQREIFVIPKSGFAKSLINDKIYMGIDNNRMFMTPGFAESVNHIIHYVVCVLINFNALFDNFSRVKSCKYCEKIFVEKREGQLYCSEYCRKKNFYYKIEPRERIKCRGRQNRWIRSHYNSQSHFSTLGKSECDKCESYLQNKPFPKWGACKILKDKNPETFREDPSFIS